jgi:hypothetical protein
MFTFRLKWLFCLLLIVSIGLMWRNWFASTEYTANRLLDLEKQMYGMEYSEFLGNIPPPPRTSDVPLASNEAEPRDKDRR